MFFQYLLAGKTDRPTDSRTYRQTESCYPCPQEKAENGPEWVEDCFSAPDDQGNLCTITNKKLPSLLSCHAHAQVRMPSMSPPLLLLLLLLLLPSRAVLGETKVASSSHEFSERDAQASLRRGKGGFVPSTEVTVLLDLTPRTSQLTPQTSHLTPHSLYITPQT